MKYFNIIICAILASGLVSCKKYLDIVPDDVATLDYAFRMRTTAEQYLFTCYSFLPDLGAKTPNPARFGADEMWLASTDQSASQMIGRGEQNANSPYNDYWNGANSATDLWTAVSQCNIFLENIESVPDMDELEIRKWASEVKVLKAYYYFFLLRMYGPIPVMKDNIPINASGEEVRVFRQPVDSVFSYIVTLLDEAREFLPPQVEDRNTELGRITLPIDLALKAKVLVYAASPLFNGNKDYAGFTSSDGVQFFDQTYSVEKWQKAAEACKVAIDTAHGLGYKLFQFVPGHDIRNISDETILEMNYRGTITEEWNSEIIWANTNSTCRSLQTGSAPRSLDANQVGWQVAHGGYGATMNVANLFYTKNGLPIDEDVTWDYSGRFKLRTGTEDEKYSIKEGYTTASLNFDRGSRYYGGLGFDGGIWYGNGKYDDNDPYWLECKAGQNCGNLDPGWHSEPGYYVKKYINYTNTPVDRSTYSTTNYPWVMLRLGDLYLLYAEALNEAYGPGDESYQYLNLIRAKAGLPSVQQSWDQYSRHPGEYSNQSGLREIIQRERCIEMAFEGQRFWDLRRWKTAPIELNNPIVGWDITEETSEGYYRKRVLFNQHFGFKDYFWPINEHDLIINRNLVQNPGW